MRKLARQPDVTGAAIPRVSKHEGSGVLRELYRTLSQCLEMIQQLRSATSDARHRACLTVIEDDVSDLVTECADYLLAGDAPPDKCLRSITLRSECVLEELYSMQLCQRAAAEFLH